MSVDQCRRDEITESVSDSSTELLTFLDDTGVPQTNNASEQAVRISVNPRKVTNGFRADWGAKASADLLSVISTSKTKGGGVIG